MQQNYVTVHDLEVYKILPWQKELPYMTHQRPIVEACSTFIDGLPRSLLKMYFI